MCPGGGGGGGIGGRAWAVEEEPYTPGQWRRRQMRGGLEEEADVLGGRGEGRHAGR